MFVFWSQFLACTSVGIATWKADRCAQLVKPIDSKHVEKPSPQRFYAPPQENLRFRHPGRALQATFCTFRRFILVVSWNRGTPSYHPFSVGSFHDKTIDFRVPPWLWNSPIQAVFEWASTPARRFSSWRIVWMTNLWRLVATKSQRWCGCWHITIWGFPKKGVPQNWRFLEVYKFIKGTHFFRVFFCV